MSASFKFPISAQRKEKAGKERGEKQNWRGRRPR